MAASIIMATLCYLVSVYVLDQYERITTNRWLDHYALNRKRNRYFALTYLGISILLGGLFPYYRYQTMDTVKALILIGFSLILAYIDKKEGIIPNHLLIVLLWFAFFFRIIEVLMEPSGWIRIVGSAVMGGLVGGGVFLLSYVISRAGVGMGDVKLFAVIGLYVGNYVIVGIMLIALVLTAVAGIINVVRKKRELKEPVPFAPYAAIGVILAMLLGF